MLRTLHMSMDACHLSSLSSIPLLEDIKVDLINDDDNPPNTTLMSSLPLVPPSLPHLKKLTISRVQPAFIVPTIIQLITNCTRLEAVDLRSLSRMPSIVTAHV